MTILAADLTLNAGDRPPAPTAYTLGPTRPALVVETNGRATSLSISPGSVEAQPVDGYGQLTGAPRSGRARHAARARRGREMAADLGRRFGRLELAAAVHVTRSRSRGRRNTRRRRAVTEVEREPGADMSETTVPYGGPDPASAPAAPAEF